MLQKTKQKKSPQVCSLPNMKIGFSFQNEFIKSINSSPPPLKVSITVPQSCPHTPECFKVGVMGRGGGAFERLTGMLRNTYCSGGRSGGRGVRRSFCVGGEKMN